MDIDAIEDEESSWNEEYDPSDDQTEDVENRTKEEGIFKGW
jgi:hypothetical protein